MSAPSNSEEAPLVDATVASEPWLFTPRRHNNGSRVLQKVAGERRGSSWDFKGRAGRAASLGFVGAVLAGSVILSRTNHKHLFWGSSVPWSSAVATPRRPHSTCNASAQAVSVSGPVKFALEWEWQDACQKLPAPPGAFFTSHWEGQNTCWDWTKKLGCYDTMGKLSWRDAQSAASSQHLAPPPEVQLLSGLRHPEMCDDRRHGAALSVSPEVTRAATQWVKDNVAVFVLNLDKDVSRLRNMSERMAKLDIPFKRIPGVDLSKPGSLEEAYRRGLVPNSFNFSMAQENANTTYHGIGGILGTVGCASAHLNAMKEALQDLYITDIPEKPLALIMEDDVVLRSDFAPKLRNLLTDEVPCDWEAVSLQSRCPYGSCVSEHLTRVEPDGNEPADRCRHGVNYGFFAMLYRSSRLRGIRDSLQRVVWDEERPRCLDVDVALASISDKVPYYAVPSVQQPGFLSEGAQGSSRWELNQVKTTSLPTTRTSTSTSTATTTATTTSTTTYPAHYPTVPGTHPNPLPILGLGDGHYAVV